MSKITAMRTKLEQGQIGHLYFMFIKYRILLTVYMTLKDIRNIQKSLNHSVNNHSEPCCGILLF